MATVTHTTIDAETGHTLVHYESGAIRDQDTARLVHPARSVLITPERAKEFAKQTKVRRARSLVRGRVRAARKALENLEKSTPGELHIEIPDPNTLTDEELLAAGGDAEELTSYLYHLGWYNNALLVATGKGGNARAMTEGYPKAFDSFDVEPGERVASHTTYIVNSDFSEALDKTLELLREIHGPKAIKGKVIDADPTP
jgi:hypothetical protein